ncbi:phosphatidylserine decarboxylase [Actinoplanes xinjiangensis]|uniref:Phosphatidylserine decarboxylase proenzyme n=1 Tax=Actinoplanes xinjiangensis TaxID=512350 RepID=A0A316EW52_9ACTN|nr:phosphatidylserine decarboxylase [Actinoplanes xinjiangensis]PWK36065.1 phosphatidylserine decarboxylase [Actinoplanes xinjiangensis]GIF42933.1 phosphatidylserine decarboxylase proenzyme [Actinoplanes xinjiangensis]
MTYTGRRLKLARGSSPWLGPVLAMTATAVMRSRRSHRWARAVPPLATLSGLMLWFFRDPERQPAEGLILSPADGVVQSIDPQPDGRTRVAIFMNPLNVHVNRAPCAGTVASVRHIPGGYLPAFNKDSDRNERVVWHLDTALGDIEVTQIAGTLARRIVPYAHAGQSVDRGERIGLIRFGSRVDVYLPAGLTPAVTLRQRTFAARTRLS